jgi:LDH2 family malate/lactate/ureidoglycolate dehydrogenase
MASSSENMTRVDHRKLTSFVSSALAKLGVPKDDAEVAAQGLVAADLRGVDTHGVIRFNPTSWYVKWLSDGEMNPKPNIRVISESASSALLDGDRGIGMVIGRRRWNWRFAKPKRQASRWSRCATAATSVCRRTTPCKGWRTT